MKKFVYSIFDKVGQVYHNPWIECSDATAARAFKIACADTGSLYGTCPGDFVLYRVGMFNDVSGTFSECENSLKVCDGYPAEFNCDVDE